MKKFIILSLLAASIGGGAYWFFSPEQQLKRKSSRILDAFTLDGSEGNISSSSGALFADSLFADKVKIKSNQGNKIKKIKGHKNHGTQEQRQVRFRR